MDPSFYSLGLRFQTSLHPQDSRELSSPQQCAGRGHFLQPIDHRRRLGLAKGEEGPFALAVTVTRVSSFSGFSFSSFVPWFSLFPECRALAVLRHLGSSPSSQTAFLSALPPAAIIQPPATCVMFAPRHVPRVHAYARSVTCVVCIVIRWVHRQEW